MTRILRFGKLFALPALLAGTVLALAQVVFASPPEASFLATVDAGTPTTGCRSVTFTSTSTDPENDIDTILWDFGDGTTDSGSSVTHTYATPGSKHVTMTVNDLDTAGDTVESDVAEQDVAVPNAAPTASYTVSDNPQAGQPITFTGSGTDSDGAIASYAWDFGGGATANTATASHTYDDHVAHSPSLVVTDNCGTASAPFAQTFTPGNTAPVVPAPTASVGGVAATVANPGQAVDFAVAPTDANGDDFTYTWNFGDGTTGTGATPSHQYAASVTSANVTVTVGDGVTTTTSPALALRVNQAPVPRFSNDPESPAVGETVTFNALTPGGASADPDGTIAKYEWNFNGTWVAGTATATHAFNAVGKVNVGLRLTDNNGRVSDPLVKEITVNKTRPTARLRYSPANPLPGQAITLTSASVPSASPGAPGITLTQWDFDYAPTGAFGPVANGTSARTSFATAGAHTVAIRVVDGSGGEDIAYAPIVVNARPRASFTVRPAKPREGSEVTFISTSSDPDGPIAKQEWDLDNDGRYDDATGVLAAKKLKKGTRTVRLRVTDSKGATDVSTQQLKVAAKPLTPPPDAISTLGYARRAWGIQVVALYVTVPSHTTVKVTCKGRGCPRGKFVRSSGKKKSTELRFKKFRGRLRAGAKIVVISYRHGSIAQYFTWGVRGHYKPPLKRKRCKALSAQKFGSCG